MLNELDQKVQLHSLVLFRLIHCITTLIFPFLIIFIASPFIIKSEEMLHEMQTLMSGCFDDKQLGFHRRQSI